MKTINKVLVGMTISILISLTVCDFEFQEYLDNPYRQLRLPPWATMTEIKKRYNELVRKYHPDKNKDGSKESKEKFMNIQKAYEKIKELRKVSKYEDEEDISDPFINQIQETGQYILAIFVIGAIFYNGVWIVYKIFEFSWKFVFSMMVALIFVEKFIPHYFKENSSQYLTSILLGIGLYYFRSIFGIFKKK
jgi:hypothetical protein